MNMDFDANKTPFQVIKSLAKRGVANNSPLKNKKKQPY